MIGQTISHYSILEKLGEGGMGVVYKAHDTKLNRTVALKFLKPQSFGTETDKSRFLTEAQAAASLDHPNICTIYAIEEAEGQTFIAMAYLEGESLHGKIQRGPLKLEEVLDISIQTADGLHQAHQKGVIHRDVKSGNILISALGLVKIMDFGLARLAGKPTITETGTTLGTPGYMSPEQARGEKVDHRTDIWSLGVVMYEMITGRLPFRGDYQEVVIYSILNEHPEPPTAVRTGVSMDLEKIVSKALAKNPEERYQHLDEMLVDLRREKKSTEQRESSQKISARGKEYRKLSAIMFSDIVSYSGIMQRDEDLAMDLLSRHNQLVRDAIRKYDGREIKVIGDAFLVDFETVVSAVRCAIEIQETISRYNEDQPEERRILLRIGIHVGDIIIKENDVFGDGVNIASRIEPLAEPGGICLSQEVYNLVKHKLDVQVISLGPKELKNIKDKIEIYEILVGSIAGKELATSGGRIVAQGRPLHKRRSTWILLGISLAILSAVFYFYLWEGPKPASTLSSRAIKVPSFEVEDPNISSDGNWIVYGARDTKGVRNLFVVPTSGGEPRKVTNDPSYSLSPPWRPCFSPDASQIVYERSEYNYEKRSSISFLYLISVQGGTSKRLVSNGSRPVWSPNGKYIVFFRSKNNEELELLRITPDGSGEQPLALIKRGPYYRFTWSPDLKRLACLRSFETKEDGEYDEVFIREIGDSSGQQITFERKPIGDLCWSSSGEIIFSSNRSGDMDLWSIPEGGGTARQLTLGTGNDQWPRISADGKRLVYLNEATSSELWSINLGTKEFQQLTFDDQKSSGAEYSPDGKRIVYYRATGYDQSKNTLLVCNSDGTEPVAIKPNIGRYNFTWQFDHPARWSSDSKSIIFNAGLLDTVRRGPDSVAMKYGVFQCEIATGLAQKIADGRFMDVSRDGRFILYVPQGQEPHNRKTGTFTASLSPRNTPERVLGKVVSIWSYPSFTKESKSVLTVDSTGYFITPIEGNAKSRKLSIPRTSSILASAPDGTFLAIIHNQNSLKLMRYAAGGKKSEEIAQLPTGAWKWISSNSWGTTGSSTWAVSPDGRSSVFSKRESKKRILLLENVR